MHRILVIDDKPEEFQKGKEAVDSAARKLRMIAAVLGNDLAHDGFVDIGQAIEDIRKGKVDAVITDLYFLPEVVGENPDRDFIQETYGDSQPPAGILIALEAIAKGIPVTICTDCGKEGRHTSKEMMWIVDVYWRNTDDKLFDMSWGKDWGTVAYRLLDKLNKSKS
jgi:hypothetical protein